MEIIRHWIITIVSVIIFVTFVEILIPNSDKRRYINVVIGLLIIIVILNPIFHLFKDQITFEDKLLEVSNQLEYTTMQNRIEHNQYLNNEAVIELYRIQLIEEMKDRLKNLWDYHVKNINIVIEDKDMENLGLIRRIDLTLSKNYSSTINKESIKPIEIAVSINKNDNTLEMDSIRIDYEEEMIKNDFSINYSLPKENINIYILEDK